MAIATTRGVVATAAARTWNLALAFEEIFTVVVRFRDGRQAPPSADSFRAGLKTWLARAEEQALGRGYKPDDVKWAKFAVVAFIDESILNSRSDAFRDWQRSPLQVELYGGNIAGEVFFQSLEQALRRQDSLETADLLEVFYLCLSLGYRGRYVAAPGELNAIMQAVREKISRCRGGASALSPRAELPDEAVPAAAGDALSKKLGLAAVACLIITALLFGGYEAMVISGASSLQTFTESR